MLVSEIAFSHYTILEADTRQSRRSSFCRRRLHLNHFAIPATALLSIANDDDAVAIDKESFRADPLPQLLTMLARVVFELLRDRWISLKSIDIHR